MALSYQKRLTLEKIETSYGTDATPAAGDAILCRGQLDINPIAGSYVSRDLITGRQGAQPDIHTNRHGMIERQIEAAASGAAGSAPAYAAVLLASGFAETTVADTSVAYTLISAGYSSTTIYAHVGGGIRQILTGCRSALSFTAERGQVPYFTVRTLGQYATPTDTALPTADFGAFRAPPTCEPSVVNAFTLGGDSLCLRSFSWADGRSPMVDKYANCAGVDIATRAITGRMVVEMPTIAEKNVLAESLDGSLQALAFEIGKTAGEKIHFNAPKVQIKFTGFEDIEGDLGAAFDLVFTPDAGDDELSITYL